MKQALQQRASNAILDWRDAETVHLIEFNFPVVTNKERGKTGRKNQQVLSFQEQIEGVAQEAVSHKAVDKHLGCRIVIACKQRNFDMMDNVPKAILDGLKNIAFGDDNVFDYGEIVRVRAFNAEEIGFTVEIVRMQAVREAWV